MLVASKWIFSRKMRHAICENNTKWKPAADIIICSDKCDDGCHDDDTEQMTY